MGREASGSWGKIRWMWSFMFQPRIADNLLDSPPVYPSSTNQYSPSPCRLTHPSHHHNQAATKEALRFWTLLILYKRLFIQSVFLFVCVFLCVPMRLYVCTLSYSVYVRQFEYHATEQSQMYKYTRCCLPQGPFLCTPYCVCLCVQKTVLTGNHTFFSLFLSVMLISH